MDIEKLLTKLAFYNQKKADVLDGSDVKERIDEQVRIYREQLEKEAEIEKQQNLKKIDVYIEVLTDLINDSDKEE